MSRYILQDDLDDDVEDLDEDDEFGEDDEESDDDEDGDEDVETWQVSQPAPFR
jgi:hypothetical protein